MAPITSAPPAQGLYDPANEHDACGVGFVAHIKGQKTHAIVGQALKILENLDHRGAVGADKLMGDGAGILIQLPDALYREEMAHQGVTLPAFGEYGVGMIFLPKEHASRLACEQEMERAIRAEGQVLLGWRDVPINRDMPMSPTVRDKEPVIRQIFIGRGPDVIVPDALERKLYVIRKTASAAIQALRLTHSREYYVPSMSCRTVIYKGLLLADQVGKYYLDLADPRVVSAIALARESVKRPYSLHQMHLMFVFLAFSVIPLLQYLTWTMPWTTGGAAIDIDGGYVVAKAPKGLRGGLVRFPKVTVGATHVTVMAAALARGETVIENAAREPEIADLCHFLNDMGADIEGVGSPTLTIHGVSPADLSAADHRVVADRVQAATYMAAVAACQGEIVVKGAQLEHMDMFIRRLREMGVQFTDQTDGILVYADGRRLRSRRRAAEYPPRASACIHSRIVPDAGDRDRSDRFPCARPLTPYGDI